MKEKVVKPRKINSSLVNWNTYSQIVDNDTDRYRYIFDELDTDTSQRSLNNAVKVFSDSLYNAASISTQPVAHQHSESIDPEVFDRANELFGGYKENVRSFQDWESVRQEAISHMIKNTSKQERENWYDVLKEKDSKNIWNKINWKGGFEPSKLSSKPSLDDLANHFKSKDQAKDNSTLLNEISGTTYVAALDKEISIDEIIEARNRIKEDKSSGDGWVKGMLTNIPAYMLIMIQVIYNTILTCHIFPSMWRKTIGMEAFKNKGSEEIAKYYRPLTLVQLLSKMLDLIFVRRFQEWFKPAEEQTAYQQKKSSSDHVFLLRCFIQHAKQYGNKLFIIAVDFDGAFDRVNRALLIRKLILFGAGVIFTSCIASIYMQTDCIIFREKDYISYRLFSGIKQGLPLSPWLFIFYINDIFTYFSNLLDGVSNSIYDLVHILMHADDATITASSRDLAIKKLECLSAYCKENEIIPQYDKCEFLVINGTDDDKTMLPFGEKLLSHEEYICILGSHLTCSGDLKAELELHMAKRYKSVIKFYNFLRSNQHAPLPVKLKVLNSCVASSLLYNCETFGNRIPDGLETTYMNMLKCALGVRLNTPNLLVYVESGFLPLKALIYGRQLMFYRRFLSTVKDEGKRRKILDELTKDESATSYLNHYLDLDARYESKENIYTEESDKIKENIRLNAENNQYKYKIYKEFNPHLSTSPYLHSLHPICADIIKFRLGSHRLPIETGRWHNVKREERKCETCQVLGDEKHALYDCQLVRRDDLQLSLNFDEIWNEKDIIELFRRLKKAELIR